VQTLEKRQGLKIACIEEIALFKGFINVAQFEKMIDSYGNCEYSNYLRRVLDEH